MTFKVDLKFKKKIKRFKSIWTKKKLFCEIEEFFFLFFFDFTSTFSNVIL